MFLENESFELPFQLTNDLKRGINIFLIDTKAMIFEIDMSRKSHHPIEDSTAKATIHYPIALFHTNNGAGMKDKGIRIKPKHFSILIQVFYLLGNIDILVMKDHSDNIETRIFIGILKTSRLIYKHT